MNSEKLTQDHVNQIVNIVMSIGEKCLRHEDTVSSFLAGVMGVGVVSLVINTITQGWARQQETQDDGK